MYRCVVIPGHTAGHRPVQDFVEITTGVQTGLSWKVDLPGLVPLPSYRVRVDSTHDGLPQDVDTMV